MEDAFRYMANLTTSGARAPRRPVRLGLAAAVLLLTAAIPPALAQERIMFPAVENAQAVLLERIRNEQVRLDVGMWLLNDGEITQAIINKHQSGVPVRVLGDRASIFESDPHTRASFERMAKAGVPIRLRYEPTWFPEIMHWKAGIFVGQGVVEFGSANWTTFELVPWSSTNFKDETAMFTDDPAIVRAFLTRFDRFWVDTEFFRDWAEVWQAETGQAWTLPMTISRTRLEPDYPTNPPGFLWSQGSELNDRMITEINAETERIDVVSYRLTVPNVTDALIARHQAGVRVRVFIEPTQYRNPAFPEYWLVGSMADKLWAAGIPIKVRTHEGLTHMKALITSRTALLASANFTKFWQRDHNYFVSATERPSLYLSMQDRFEEMWNDTANYRTFTPAHPDAARLHAPASGSTGVPNPPRLEWRRAPWAVAFDVYVGTSQSNMAFAGRVNAQVDEFPPETYSFTPSGLQPNTTYVWRVFSRTYATDVNPALTEASEIWSFTTGGSSGGGSSGPFTGTPVALPGTIQMENFDTGGAGVAYSDTTSGNSGGEYRTTDVDIEATSDAGGGYNVGWVRPGEWLKYTVNVSAAGTYTLEFRVAASAAGGTFHLEVNGVDRTGPLTVPNTGSWQSWTTLTKTGVSLPAGQQVWRIVFDAFGPGGVLGNFNSVRVVSGSTGGGGGSTPFGGTPVSLPGVIQSENFDEGGAGVAYFDTTSGNAGGAYRSTDVDIETASDAGGGYNVGWTTVGEWLQYTVNVTAAGTYTLEFRVAARAPGATFHLEVNGVDKTGPLTVPDTGGYQVWATVTKTGVSLSAGQQKWRLVIDAAGTVVGNFNYIRVVSGSTGGGGSTPFGGTPMSLPGVIQSENFDGGGAGVAYFDTTSGNAGGAYRSTDVDIETTSDAGGGYNVGWTAVGEWLQYTVNVATAGTYTLEFRVAARAPGATFHLEVNGVDKTGPLTVPNTGSYQTWATVTRTGVSLSAGQQTWRLVIDAAGTVVGNFNYIRVAGGSSADAGTSAPFGGTPAAVPGTIEAEHFDEGGEGVAYHDLTPSHDGWQHRATDVDLESSLDTGGGYAVGYALAGEWLNYTASVSAPGTYTLDVRVASHGQGGTFHIEVDGEDKTGPLAIPNTGGWWTWTTIRKTGVSLDAGEQELRLVTDANSSTGFVGNVNWFRLTTS